MSRSAIQSQEGSVPMIARFDDLFSERGIPFFPDNPHLILHLAEGHADAAVTTQASEALKTRPYLRFAASEHTAIGDNTWLRFVEDEEPILAEHVKLQLPNGLALTYGQLLALSGDFYGVVNQPINEGTTAPERMQRFNAAFDSLAVLPASRAEAMQILEVMRKEIDAVNQALKEGKPPHEAYDALGDTLSEKWNRITGGGSFVSALVPLGRYLQLAASNTDHFGEWALLAYIAGHTAALQIAIAAGVNKDVQLLAYAYAKNAFADHYLCDLFCAGHLRVPRKAMAAVVTPSDLGSLISRFMHHEDSRFGLDVSNARDEQWRACGDACYFEASATDNRIQVNQTVQASADEVFAAYLCGTLPEPSTFAALQRLPDLRLTNNFSPLFRVDNGKVLRRKDVNNLNDTATVDDWWGWSTYLLLKNYHPTGNVNQGQWP
ncbi:phospholipase [Pseudomonas sp. ITA]|uniref:phospholipase n=1 Tax=Pseudomonas sp. ITA TaxID=2825841 RepID=UPI0024979F8C|nr:phospholipase [Pseudomonas sp. ITA]MDI2146195.1 phospholipase [Pseudomonas sp. ITA]